jgi:predicted RNA binding protein YcfA (HicA-like mRNA interferase family)
MPRFPAVTAKDVIRIAHNLGFEFSRQSGTSHAVYKRQSDKRRVIIPKHPSITVKRKTLAAIISDLGITIEEFRKLLK